MIGVAVVLIERVKRKIGEHCRPVANATMGGYALNLIGAGKTDVSGLEKDVAAIRQQGDESRFVDGQGNTIIRYKNLTRKIKN